MMLDYVVCLHRPGLGENDTTVPFRAGRCQGNRTFVVRQEIGVAMSWTGLRAALLALGLAVGVVAEAGGALAGREDEPLVPMERGGPARTGEMPGPGPEDEPDERWRFEAEVSGAATGLVVDEDRVFVAIGGNDGTLYALDRDDGDLRWSRPESGCATPALGEGVVYAATIDGIVALESDSGDEVWSLPTGTLIDSPLALVDDVLYFGEIGSTVHAVDAESGEPLWRFVLGGLATSPPAVADDTVFVGSSDFNLYALDAETGEERWRFATGGEVQSTPVVAADAVYVRGFDHLVYALDVDDGSVLWRYDTVLGVGELAVADGLLVVGRRGTADDPAQEAVVALDAETGEERWIFADEFQEQVRPTIADGVVYVGSGVYDGSAEPSLFALDADDGDLLWRYETGGTVLAEPVVVDGTVYLGGYRGVGDLFMVVRALEED
jgi:eukaryotic-like serine/threonine-protein kinase